MIICNFSFAKSTQVPLSLQFSSRFLVEVRRRAVINCCDECAEIADFCDIPANKCDLPPSRRFFLGHTIDALNNDDLPTQRQVMSEDSLITTTEPLAKSQSMNPDVIRVMRQEGRFPMLHKSIGSKIVCSIVSVA